MLVNIGLDVAGTRNTVQERVERANLAYMILRTLYTERELISVEYRNSESEPTMVLQILDTVENAKTFFWYLSRDLRQDCIALVDDNGQNGVLVGPKAEKWGEFNPEFFLFPKVKQTA